MADRRPFSHCGFLIAVAVGIRVLFAADAAIAQGSRGVDGIENEVRDPFVDGAILYAVSADDGTAWRGDGCDCTGMPMLDTDGNPYELLAIAVMGGGADG